MSQWQIMFLPLPSFKLGSTSQAVNHISIGMNRERGEQQHSRKRCLTELYRMHRTEIISSISLIIMCIEHLNSDNNPECIVDIMTGRIAPYTDNVANYVATGKERMKQFETSWPESFYEPLSNKVFTMAVSYK